MKRALRIGTLAGIDVFVHWTFSLLIAWVVYIHLRSGDSFLRTLEGVGFILALFGCVLLHELGHALAARQFGIRTRDITLLPIGGVARLERMPRAPLRELWVAIAGPLVNVAIAGVLAAILAADGSLAPEARMLDMGGPFLTRLLWVNIALVAFNLLPAFPMDGGRVLRAFLAMRFDHAKATRIAAVIGQVVAVFFVVAGLFSNPFLLLIGVFIFLGAQQEARAATAMAAIENVRVGAVMQTGIRAVRDDAPIAAALAMLSAGTQQDFPVVADDGTPIGVVTRADLLRAADTFDPDAPVVRCMRDDRPFVEDGDLLETALQRMHALDRSSLAVTRNGALVGMLVAS